LAGQVQPPDRVIPEELVEPGARDLGRAPDGGRHHLEGGVHLPELVPGRPRHRFLSLAPLWRSSGWARSPRPRRWRARSRSAARSWLTTSRRVAAVSTGIGRRRPPPPCWP